MQIMKSKKAAVQVLALIVGMASIGGAARAASFRKVSAVGTCQPFPNSGTAEVVSSGAAGTGGLQLANTSPTNVHLVCPIMSDSAALTGAANLVQLTGWATTTASTGIEARACVTFVGGGGGGCKPGSATALNTGVTTIQIDPKSVSGGIGWDENFGTDLAYLYVKMGPNNVIWSLAFFTP